MHISIRLFNVHIKNTEKYQLFSVTSSFFSPLTLLLAAGLSVLGLFLSGIIQFEQLTLQSISHFSSSPRISHIYISSNYCTSLAICQCVHSNDFSCISCLSSVSKFDGKGSILSENKVDLVIYNIHFFLSSALLSLVSDS